MRAKRLMTLLLAISTVLSATPTCGVHGQDAGQKFTVQVLYELCRSSALTDEAGCGLYLTGVADMMEQVAFELNKPWTTKAARSDLSIHAICTSGYSGAQLRQLFINWAE